MYIFFNLTKAGTQFMNGAVPWRGGREKDSLSMQVLIKTLIRLGGVVLEAYASICVAFSHSHINPWNIVSSTISNYYLVKTFWVCLSMLADKEIIILYHKREIQKLMALFLLNCVMHLMLPSVLQVRLIYISLLMTMHRLGRWLNTLTLVSKLVM